MKAIGPQPIGMDALSRCARALVEQARREPWMLAALVFGGGLWAWVVHQAPTLTILTLPLLWWADQLLTMRQDKVSWFVLSHSWGSWLVWLLPGSVWVAAELMLAYELGAQEPALQNSWLFFVVWVAYHVVRPYGAGGMVGWFSRLTPTPLQAFEWQRKMMDQSFMVWFLATWGGWIGLTCGLAWGHGWALGLALWGWRMWTRFVFHEVMGQPPHQPIVATVQANQTFLAPAQVKLG